MQVSQIILQHVLNGLVRYSTDVVGVGSCGEDDFRERAFFILEALAFNSGRSLMNQCTINHGYLFMDDLDLMKFVCREFWSLIFAKSIDNLKTNHKGTFVLHDQAFPWIVPLKEDSLLPEAGRMATLLLAFPCGFLRGSMSIYDSHHQSIEGVVGDSLSITSTHADIVQIPHCAFQVKRASKAESSM